VFTLGYFVAVALVLAVALPLARGRFLAAGHSAWARRALLVLVGGLSVGTVSHVENLLRAGLVPLPDQPRAFNAFWSALTVLDPLGAVLLVVRPRLGIALTVAIMVADVTINVVAVGHRGVVRPPNVALLCQIAYGAFALAAAPWLWRASGAGDLRLNASAATASRQPPSRGGP
jgi:hypothetical protein